ncbi:MAG: Bug family tripartite tricarboxylate transporter substrate binding protein [Ostreibacterium sp.]
MNKLVIALAILSISQVYAEKYPTKSIDVVTHSGAGGGTDLTARMMAKVIEPLLGQKIPIVSRKGGGGSVSLKYLMSQPADGYTILTYTSGQAGEIAKNSTKVTLDDIVPIARATDDPQILMVKCGIYKNATDFINQQKTQSLTYGTTHLGGIDDVSAYSFTKLAKLKIAQPIPYQSAAEIAVQLVAGGVNVGVLNLGEAKSQIEAGKVCPIVVLANKRMNALPKVPTAKELGIPLSLSTVRGFVVAKGTPPEIVAQLEKTLLEGMKGQAFNHFLTSIGLDENSVVGADEWGKQIKKIDTVMKDSLKVLGFIQ